MLICEKAHIKRSGCLKSENIKWYDGQQLLEYLETVDIDSENEEKEFESFINEYYSLNDAEKNHFFAKWMNFGTYRKVVIDR